MLDPKCVAPDRPLDLLARYRPSHSDHGRVIAIRDPALSMRALSAHDRVLSSALILVPSTKTLQAALYTGLHKRRWPCPRRIPGDWSANKNLRTQANGFRIARYPG